MASVQVIAQQGDEIFKKIMEFEPTAATVASVVIPGAAPVVAMVQPEILILAPIIEKALDDISASSGGADAAGTAVSALLQLIMHLTKGMPNAPGLAPIPQFESAQGSG